MSAIFFMPEKEPPGPIWGPPGPFFAWAGKIQKLPKFSLFSLVGQWANSANRFESADPAVRYGLPSPQGSDTSQRGPGAFAAIIAKVGICLVETLLQSNRKLASHTGLAKCFQCQQIFNTPPRWINSSGGSISAESQHPAHKKNKWRSAEAGKSCLEAV